MNFGVFKPNIIAYVGFPGDPDGDKSACRCRRPEFNSWVGKIPLEKGMATPSSILAWRIPWTEEPGGLQSRGVTKELDTAEMLTHT